MTRDRNLDTIASFGRRSERTVAGLLEQLGTSGGQSCGGHPKECTVAGSMATPVVDAYHLQRKDDRYLTGKLFL